MALPAVADVRRHFTGARIVVAARRSVAGLFRLVPAVDDVVTLEWNGSLVRSGARRHDAGRIRTLAPDIAILFPNSFAAAWLAHSAAVPERWGYARDLRRPLLSRAVATPTSSVHQGAYYQHLVGALGIDRGPLEPVVRIAEPAVESARQTLIGRGWDGARPVAVIAPGAAYGTAKRWPPAYFGALAADLIGQRGMHVVCVGSAADRETTTWVTRDAPEHARRFITDLAGETTLESLGGVLRLAGVCVSNDSGTMHFAAAVGVPVAALFGPTRERETAPLPVPGTEARVLINPVWCRPCMLRECPIDHRCMTGLTPLVVSDAVGDLLVGRDGRGARGQA
jgi:heptosyltransferase-2